MALFASALERLGHERRLAPSGERTILVAGTNGKGTVSKTLETLLSRPGRSIGLFTSPHMMETTERIRRDGSDLTREQFVECFRVVEPFSEGLSHFEILTLMMAEAFFGGRIARPVDFAVIEVGLGGRLDPTRSFPHGVSVVTRIGLDHEELLGNTLTEIAREKFAIVDPGNVVFTAPLERETRIAFDERRRETQARYFEVPTAEFSVSRGARAPVWRLRTKWGDVDLAMKGKRAADNALVALHVMEAIGEDVSAALPKLGRVEWPCRMEGFEIAGREVYLSGDHNEQGAESLVEILREFERPAIHLIVGLGRNKRVESFMSPLTKIAGVRFHLTRTTFRGGDLSRYGDWKAKAASLHEDPSDALAHVLRTAAPDDLIVVTGSLYLTGDLRRRIVQGFFGELGPEPGPATKPIK